MTTLCRLFRGWWSWRADQPCLPPAWPRHHGDRCPECRAWLARQQSLGAALVRAAPAARADAPPFLASRIVAAVARTHTAPQAAARATSPLRGWTVAAGLATGLVAVALWLDLPRPRDPSLATVPRPASDSLAAALAPEGLAGIERWLELGRRFDAPLQTELDAVVHDARSAVAFLAQSALLVTDAKTPEAAETRN